MVIEDFLGRTASQLTYHGLCELNKTVQEEELCVFFRNNHFSTLYKHKEELFLLVTDQGFLTEPTVIWETLINIEGDGQFVNHEYRTIQLESPAVGGGASGNNVTATMAQQQQQVATEINSTPAVTSNLSQEDQDYLIALSLSQQDQPNNTPILPPKKHSSQQQPQVGDNSNIASQFDRDHALALQLQQDEDRHAQEQQQQPIDQQERPPAVQQPQQQSQSSPQQAQPPQAQTPQAQQQPQQRGGGDNDKCSIL